MSVVVGQILDAKYRIDRVIGAGGMGSVYEGENLRIGRRVAIKVLNAGVAQLSELTERFAREARVAAKVGSKHVCDVLDLGDLPNGDHYLVMELLEGQSLEERLTAGRLSSPELVPIAMELLDGLGTMHHAGVIHRDLKPANVFLARTADGRGEMVKILDFGVAKLEGFGPGGASMTRTGAMIGTPLYMSPEQARGARDVDARTDLYAASVIFYRALTGQLPHYAENLNELLFKVVLEDARPIRQLAPGIDEELARIIHRGLAREVDDRFPSARAYQDALVAWARTQGRPSLDLRATLPTMPPPAEPSPTGAVVLPPAGTPVAWAEEAAERSPRAEPASGAGPAAPDASLTTSAAGVADTQVSAPSPLASKPPVVRVSERPPVLPEKAIAEPRRVRWKALALVGAAVVVVVSVVSLRREAPAGGQDGPAAVERAPVDAPARLETLPPTDAGAHR